jgi:hypothetical protein
MCAQLVAVTHTTENALEDYSPDRKGSIKRTVCLTSSKKGADSIADKLVEENVKKGWESAG